MKDKKKVAGLPERLLSIRLLLRKSQREFAAELNIGEQVLQAYESGKTSPGAAVIAGLHAMGIDANWLVSGKGTIFLTTIPETSPMLKYFYGWLSSIEEQAAYMKTAIDSLNKN
ncbi:MAG: helix-turn-helix transcriptional regulator [Candidatus Babeliales bacterium]|jgi:transcriptional regulator with XRE-family HTH domain